MFIYKRYRLFILLLLMGNFSLLSKSTDFAEQLRLAVEAGDVSATSTLLEAGLSVDTPDANDGFTLLHAATRGGYLEIVALLLDWGADPDLGDALGRRPLHYAVRNAHRSIVQALLDIKANTEVKTVYDGTTPLHWAVQTGRLELVNDLLDAYADVNACDEDKNTPLHVAAIHGNADIVRLLLERGARLNALNRHNLAPIYEAFRHERPRRTSMIQAFTQAGAIVDVHGTLNYRLAVERPEIALGMIRWGAVGDRLDMYGRTLLSYIAEGGQKNIAEALISAGANVHTIDARGLTPFDYAQARGHTVIAHCLIIAGAETRQTGPSNRMTRSAPQIIAQPLVDPGARLFMSTTTLDGLTNTRQ